MRPFALSGISSRRCQGSDNELAMFDGQGLDMNNWITAVDTLRMVRRAREDFMMRGLIEQLFIGPQLLDRLADDLFGGRSMTSMQDRTRPADDD